MYQAILFDLDGTLTASGEGITKSVQYAMRKMGIIEEDLKKLEVFVGPPLMEQFMKYCTFTQEQAEEAVRYYRERYRETGIFENRPYEGICSLLEKLKKQGYLLAVASSKPTYFVEQILEHFQMRQYFHQVVGSELDGTRTNKAEVIEEALRRLEMSERRQDVVMVGDKEHDAYGARKAGLDCICVLYGYGTLEELTAAAPMKIVKTVQELSDFFSEAL